MEKTRHVLLIRRFITNNVINSSNILFPAYSKTITTKASNRAAVHGVKLPIPDAIDKEEVEKEIQKAKEEKEAKRKLIEKTIESHSSNTNSSNSQSES